MKRQVIVLLVLSIIASAVLATGVSEPQERADSLVVGQIAEPTALDPHTVTSVNDFRILANMFEGLVRFADGSLTVEPALATDWEISSDGLVYTFELREGVVFHDGTPFNAAAVAFNFERMLDQSHPYHATGPFPLAISFDAIADTRVLDEYTVQLILSEPFAPLLSNLAYPAGMLVSPTAVATYGDDFGWNPVGTGPYRFVEWELNTRVTLEANPDYWGPEPNVGEIVFRPITDSNTRVTEMLAGDLDLIVEVPPDSVQVFAERDGFTVHAQAGPHLWYLILNLREGPFASKALRQAVNYAIDKDALVNNVLRETATIAAGPVPPAFAWAYNDQLDPYPYDPARAVELIAESGYNGEELVFYVAEGGSGMLEPVPMGRAIRADLEAVGLNVSVETYDWNTYLRRVNSGLAGKADMAQMAWMTSDPDTLPFLALRTEAWPENGGFNSGYYSNVRVDELLLRARTSSDRVERARLYREVQEIVHEDAPWVFVANWQQNAVTVEGLKNFRLQPSFLLHLGGVSFE